MTIKVAYQIQMCAVATAAGVMSGFAVADVAAGRWPAFAPDATFALLGMALAAWGWRAGRRCGLLAVVAAILSALPAPAQAPSPPPFVPVPDPAPKPMPRHPKWVTYAEAEKQAQADPQKVWFAYWSRKGCAPCVQMELGTLTDPRVLDELERCVCVRLDMDAEAAKARALGLDGSPAVTVAVGGKVTHRITGLAGAGELLKAIGEARKPAPAKAAPKPKAAPAAARKARTVTYKVAMFAVPVGNPWCVFLTDDNGVDRDQLDNNTTAYERDGGGITVNGAKSDVAGVIRLLITARDVTVTLEIIDGLYVPIRSAAFASRAESGPPPAKKPEGAPSPAPALHPKGDKADPARRLPLIRRMLGKLSPAVQLSCGNVSGSGTCVRCRDGVCLVVTNRHVVEGFESGRWTVSAADRWYAGTVKAVSPDPAVDLALIECRGELPAAPLADRDDAGTPVRRLGFGGGALRVRFGKLLDVVSFQNARKPTRLVVEAGRDERTCEVIEEYRGQPARARLKDTVRWDDGGLTLVPQDGPAVRLALCGEPR